MHAHTSLVEDGRRARPSRHAQAQDPTTTAEQTHQEDVTEGDAIPRSRYGVEGRRRPWLGRVECLSLLIAANY